MEELSIDVISDIHLEFKRWKLSSNGGDILIIAGDLGKPTSKSYHQFLTDVSTLYRHIILVSGNHEYYGTTIANSERLIQKAVEKLDNVHYLQKNSVEIDGYTFLGCTLWSNPSTSKWLINDGQCINDMSLAKYKEIHLDHKSWLDEMLKHDRKHIVVTHHLPSFECIADVYKTDISSKINEFFASECDELVKRSIMWFCGHSHTETHTIIGSTTVHLCPKGYPWETRKDYCPYRIRLPKLM